MRWMYEFLVKRRSVLPQKTRAIEPPSVKRMVRPALTMRGSTYPFFMIHGIRNCETPVHRGQEVISELTLHTQAGREVAYRNPIRFC